MADDRRNDRNDRSGGLDVWLPAAAAIGAALFMLASAHAADGPHRIYDEARFSAAAVERDAAEAAIARGDYAALAADEAVRQADRARVDVAPLPPLDPSPVQAGPEALAVAAVAPAQPAARASGWGRVAAALAIAALLIGALVGIGRVWQRTEPSLT